MTQQEKKKELDTTVLISTKDQVMVDILTSFFNYPVYVSPHYLFFILKFNSKVTLNCHKIFYTTILNFQTLLV